MKLAKVKQKEIDSIRKFFQEVKWIGQELQTCHFEGIDFSDYPLLKELNRESAEDFLTDLCRLADNLFWEKALWNLETLLDNCADPDQGTLDFNPAIKKGLALLETKATN